MAPASLPKWQCHKVVRAAKIARIEETQGGGAILHLEEGGPVRVNDLWLDRFEPYAGGYFVLYNDEYRSFSPAPAFEEGYTRLGD